MAKSETRKPKKVGRPPMAMPEPIPDTLENVMDAVLSTPPKKRGEWRYLQSKEGVKWPHTATQEGSI